MTDTRSSPVPVPSAALAGGPGRSVVILCHSDQHEGRRGSGSGPIVPLLTYLRACGTPWVFLIEQPHPNVPGSLDCTLEVYRDGALVATHVSRRWRWLYAMSPERRRLRMYLRLKLRDLLAGIDLLRLIARRYPDAGPVDTLIGVEFINVIVGHWLRRRLGVRRIIYYIFDWAPQRYAHAWMNRLYIALDRYACRVAEATWNITWTIERTRLDTLHYDPRYMGLQQVVLYGVEFREALVRPTAELERFCVVFAGGLHDTNGAHWLPEIARRLQAANPRIRLLVAGDGPLMPTIRERLKADGTANVELLGHISDPEAIDRLQCRALIGLAPYPDVPGTTKKWGDVIKIRSYFSCGLVVVTTAIPPVSREIVQEELGVVCPEDPAAMADAILALCADEARLLRLRDNVIRKACGHTWRAIYDRAFEEMAAASGRGGSVGAVSTPSSDHQASA